MLRPAVALAVLGTFLTAAITGLAAAGLFDLGMIEGLLVGSIIAATDGAAIFALLRAPPQAPPRAHPGGRGRNPVAILLVIGFVEWIEQPDYGALDMALLFVRQLGIGLVAGVLVGLAGGPGAAAGAPGHCRPDPVGARWPPPPWPTGRPTRSRGSGFLAAYLAGLVLGSGPIPAKRTVTVFHEGLGWLAQIFLFVVLGRCSSSPRSCRARPSRAPGACARVLLVARPLAVFVGHRGSSASRSSTAWCWAGPACAAQSGGARHLPGDRGRAARPRVLQHRLLCGGDLHAGQGVTFEPFARAVGATTTEPALPRPLAETGTIRRLGAEIVEYPVGPEDAIMGQVVRDLGLPRDAPAQRDRAWRRRISPQRPPRGWRRADHLHDVVRQEGGRSGSPRLLERWHSGPSGSHRPTHRHAAPPAVFTPWRRDRGGRRPRLSRGAWRGWTFWTTYAPPVGSPARWCCSRTAASRRPDPSRGRGAAQIQRFARRRLADESDDAARAWWQEVIGALAR